MPVTKCKCLVLEDGENLETTLFRVNKGWKLKFTLSPSLQPHDLQLFCNHPSINGDLFQRDKYYELSWMYPFPCKSDDGDRYSTLVVTKAGSFHFYLVTKGESKEKARCTGYFVVDPSLEVGSGPIPLDGVVMQTVLSKCLGPFSEWEGRLRVGKETGYNAFHFTPVQELGESNSSYSLKDQLQLNSAFSEPGKPVGFKDLESFIKKLQNEWNMLSVTDVVWNHTANNTEWLKHHPEAAYNLENSPHMRPAYLADRALWYFNNEVSQGKWEQHGIPSVISQEYHLEKIDNVLRNFVLPPLKLHEFFIVDVEKIASEFKAAAKSLKPPVENNEENTGDENQVAIIQDSLYRRNGCRVNIKQALALFNKPRPHLAADEEERIEQCCWELKSKLFQLNEEKMQQVHDHYDTIVFNSIGHIRFHFMEDNGPKYGKVTRRTPLISRYFMCPQSDTNIEEEEKLMNSEKAKFVFAHPGWVMGADALKDFAGPDSQVYLRRELICWGDSVKLRYGTGPQDSPFLWEYMKKYTQLMARIFHGFRLDNCHSTPIILAEYLLDAAREVNPELYVIAELFTNSEDVDNAFICRLGINSLIRERMGAHDAHDLGRHVFRFGGEPVGSFMKPETSPLRPTMAHAVFMDLTHDNRSPVEVHSVFDLLPSSALVAISSCGIGSNRGYDELVPEHINVVTDDRKYKSWKESSDPKRGNVSIDDGILRAKKALNVLHQRLARDGFNQIYVDQVDANIVSVTRHCPLTHESLILVAHTAFSEPSDSQRPTTDNHHGHGGYVPPLVIPGVLDEIVFEAQLLEDPAEAEYSRDKNFINGLENYVLKMQENIKVKESKLCVDVISDERAMQEVHFNNFLPGSVIIFKVSLKPKMTKATHALRCVLGMFPEQGFEFRVVNESHSSIEPIDPAIKELSLADLNRVLYRCDAEERDDGYGGGVYNIPNFGSLTYCGLQGFMSVLSIVAADNDLGHPICDNLRDGDWMSGYTASRLKHNHGTRALGLWFESVFWYLRELPRYLIPCYFDAIVRSVYVRLVEHAFSKMSKFVQDGSDFVKYLSLGSVQMCGLTNTALPPVSSKLEKLYSDCAMVHSHELLLTMAAGLPHFSVGFMRCWGRDTFIALRGLLLVTGRFAVARNLILSFAGCIRHGLVPNLLGAGHGARYNCRDAAWWWLQAIQDFCKMAPHGIKLLTSPVKRMYPTDDSEPQYDGQAKEQPLYELIQEVLQRHIDIISFRERNAGPALDSNMSKDGFNLTAGVDLETGFVYGGSKWNCGTWMDKMGESTLAGNWGHPATPRYFDDFFESPDV